MAEMDTGSDGGSTDDGSTEDGGSDDSGGDGSGSIWSILTAFAKDPTAFILGAILAFLLAGLETIVLAVIDAVQIVFVGSGPGTTGTLGLADLPIYAAELLTTAGSLVGTEILDAVDKLFEVALDVSAAAGPLGPPIAAAFVVLVVVSTLWVLEQLVRIGFDAIPGLGGLL